LRAALRFLGIADPAAIRAKTAARMLRQAADSVDRRSFPAAAAPPMQPPIGHTAPV
jgi:hypothetical protein